MQYPVRLKKDGAFFLVTFPDIPEAITQGEGREDALYHAVDALESALDFYFEKQKKIPLPSSPQRGQYVIDLVPVVVAKILLLNELIRQKVSVEELAHRLGTSARSVRDLLNSNHSTSMDRVHHAMLALGKRFVLSVA